MFGNLRNKMPSIDEAAEVARDSVIWAANQTAASAREMGEQLSEQLEDWAKDGYEAVRERPILWGAASLGVGAVIGGLYALWQREAKRDIRPNGMAMAARSRSKRIMRMESETKGRANGRVNGRKRKRARKARIAREAAISE
jgi:hypothetical protein